MSSEGNFEQRPKTPEEPGKPEKFDDLNLQEGDAIISKSGTTREILTIIRDQRESSGDYIRVNTMPVDDSTARIENISFAKILANYAAIAKFDRAPRLENISLDDPRITSQQRASLKALRVELAKPDLRQETKSSLRLKIARLLRQIFPEENPKTPDDEP